MSSHRVTIYRNPSGSASARREIPEVIPAAQTAARTAQRGNSGFASAGRAVTCAERKAGSNPVPAATAGVYGAAFQVGPERLTVTEPGGVVPVSLSDSALAGKGVMHDAGTAEMLVRDAGDYMIEFALYVTSDNAKTAVFALQADGGNIAGGVRDVPLQPGYQAVTGFALARLSGNSRVRIAMTAPSPMEVLLAGSGTTAALSVRKL